MASDLHCHTKISDGSLGIEDLIGIAKRRGITTLSVTDHDTTAGATRAVILGRRLGVRVIHGVEFSAKDPARGGETVQLLCYRCSYPDRLEGLCRRIAESRRAAGLEMVRKVMRYYPITSELVAKCATGSTNIYKQHIMHALMDAGYADSVYGEVYQKLFGLNGSAAVAVEYPDVYEVLRAIHEAEGIAVLAHPFQHTDDTGLLEELSAAGLDGVEVWHPTHTEEQAERLSRFADEHRLLKTGGSDFHGMYSAKSRALCSVSVPDECVDALLKYPLGKKD